MTEFASVGVRQRPVGEAPARLGFRLYSGEDGLAEVEREWDAAAVTVAHPRFQHLYPWFAACARHAAGPGSARVFVARDGDVPVGIFPLVARARRIGGVPVRALELHASAHALMCDVVFEPCPARAGLVAALVEHLRAEVPGWDVLALPNLLEDSAGWFSLSACPPARLVVEEAEGCKVLPVIPSEQRLAALPKSFRGTLRRSRTRLAEQPGVEFVRARTPAELPEAVAAFLEVEGSGWKGAHGSAINRDERRVAFYRSVALDFAALGLAEVNLLRIAGKPAAAEFCLKVGRCLYLLKVGYDEQFAKLVPGHLLLEHVLERCAAERDVDTVNLVSDAPWSAYWRAQELARRSAFVFNATARGLASYAAMRGRQALRPAVRRLRAALRRPPGARNASGGEA